MLTRISFSAVVAALHFSAAGAFYRTAPFTTRTSVRMNAEHVSRRDAFTSSAGIATAAVCAALSGSPSPVAARLESVNKPELLPTEPGQNVIQVEKFLTSGQQKNIQKLTTSLEKDTGFRLRVLCQAYPRTPGLAITDYWDVGKEGAKDDKFIVMVVDEFGGKGNALNFNVGDGLKLNLPSIFWTRLQSKYGTIFYIKENGIDLAITSAVEAIVQCLRTEEQFCVNVPDMGVSLKSLGMN